MKRLSSLDMALNQILNHVLHTIAGDSSSTTNGTIWHNSSTNKVRARLNGANVTLVSDGSDLPAGSVANTALTTNPLDRGNHINTQLAATISNLATTVKAYRLDEFAVPTADVPFNNRKITGLANGVSASDAAAYGQIQTLIDSTLEGKDWKQAVRAATTAAVTLSTGLVNGSTIDGVTLATGDRILVKNQAAPAENGIRVVAASGIPPRAADANTAAELKNATVIISEGTTLAGTQWTQTTDTAITVDTTALNFAQTGAGGATYTAGNGLTLSTNDFNVGAGTGISVAADSVAIDTSVVVRKVVQLIGNGSLTSIGITHSLGTKAITYSIRQVSDDSFVECDVVATSTSVATFTFAVAPASNALEVTIHG